MKKRLSLKTAICVCVFSTALCSCGSQNTTDAQNTLSESESSSIIESNEPLETTDDSTPSPENQYAIMSAEEFMSCFETHEITLDNWEEYFKLEDFTYTIPYYTEKDVFGEGGGEIDYVDTYTSIYVCLKDESHIFCGTPFPSDEYDGSVAFRFQITESYTVMNVFDLQEPQLEVNETNRKSERDLLFPSSQIRASIWYKNYIRHLTGKSSDYTIFNSDISQCDLIKVKGYVTEFSIPSVEKWNTDSSGDRYLLVQDRSNSNICVFYENGYASSFPNRPSFSNALSHIEAEKDTSKNAEGFCVYLGKWFAFFINDHKEWFK